MVLGRRTSKQEEILLYTNSVSLLSQHHASGQGLIPIRTIGDEITQLMDLRLTATQNRPDH